MKKFYRLALIVFTLFSSVMFFACGDKYADLEMSFYSADVQVIEEVELLIDKSKPEAASKKIAVKLSGIETEDIGQVLIYSSNNVITTSPLVYENNFVWTTITARASSLSSEIIVRHLGSNKTASIKLVVHQKAESLQVNNSKYFISTPETGTNSHIINSDDIVTLYPAGSTDKVYYKASGVILPTINPIYEDVAGSQYIIGFNSTSTTTGSVKLNPVTVCGDTASVHTNKFVEVFFGRALNESNFTLDVEDKYKDEAGEILSPINLVYNDINKSSIEISLSFIDVDDDIVSKYALNLSSSNQNKIILLDKGDDCIVIQAKAYSEEIEYATISMVPNGYVGGIETVSKTIAIKVVAKADLINVKKGNTQITDLNATIDLYDHYNVKGNEYGPKFEFIPTSYVNAPVYENFQRMHFIVNPKILNMEYNKDIYDGDDFNNKILTHSSDWGKNGYVLNISMGSAPMRFYYDSVKSVFVSEPFTKNNKIYIKCKMANKLGNEHLSLKVETMYAGNLNYLRDMEPTSQILNFAGKAGIETASIVAGYYYKDTDVVNNNYIGDFSDKTIYLNTVYGLDNPTVATDRNSHVHNRPDNANEYTQYLMLSDLEGSGNKISTEMLNITVTSKNAVYNSLMVTQGLITKEENQEIEDIFKSCDPKTNLVFHYDELDMIGSPYIGLYFTTSTDVGEYLITISQPETGFAIKIICKVYKDIYDSDVVTELETTELSLKNNGEYTGYTSDYIVAAGETLELKVLIADTNQSNSHIIKEIKLTSDWSDSVDPRYNIGDYIQSTIGGANNIFELKFLKGTYIDKNEYISLNISIEIRVYESIIKETTSGFIKKELKVFVYEPISYSDIKITAPNQRYMYDYLGIEYQTESIAELTVNMDSNLWNYVQAKEQTNDDAGIGLFGRFKTVWTVNDSKDFIFPQDQTDNSLKVQFGKSNSQSINDAYIRKFTAKITQFNSTFTITYQINVDRSIIANKVILLSQVDVNQDNSYSINIKDGGTYKVLADSFSDYGEVTHKSFAIQVFDHNGIPSQSDIIDVNQNTLEITVNKVVPGYKLVVFAKDALKKIASPHVMGYNNPSSFLVDFQNQAGVPIHKDAYVVIDLLLSDGKTKETAYLIRTADDFWQIAEEHNNTTYTNPAPYYRLMNNIDLSSASMAPTNINSFKGTIFTNLDTDRDNNYKFFTIYGISLGAGKLTNIFTNFNGCLEDIKFVVSYIYDYSNIRTDLNLGVIDINNGTLKSVSCEISGTSKFYLETNTNLTVDFGGLVGLNCGIIEFNDVDKQHIGTSGDITIVGNSYIQINFGGLVGKNVGNIIGYKLSSNDESDVKFTISVSDAGKMSNLNIKAGLANENSSVGGLVGFNTRLGCVKNAEVGGSINGIYNDVITNNIGGLIGRNAIDPVTDPETDPISVAITVHDDKIYPINKTLNAQISYIKSYTTIIGGNNIGGVVGVDQFGIYSNIMYQILADVGTAINGYKYVGGIAGASYAGKFDFCSVMSYKWDYLNPDFSGDAQPDIVAENYLGGLVGGAKSDIVSIIRDGEEYSHTGLLLIEHSSVNGFISSNNLVGGLVSYHESNTGLAVMRDVYFLGLVVGDSKNHSLETQESRSVKDVYYSVVYNQVKNSTPTIYSFNNGANNLEIDVDPSLDYWNHNADLNGGYIYITTEADNETPIFEVAPTKIEVEVQPKQDTDNDREYDDSDNIYYVNENTLWLHYYKFTGAESGELSTSKLSELNSRYNTVTDLTSFLKFTISPDGGARLKVSSSDVGILTVTQDGSLIIRGTGKCKLIFSSRLNSGVKAEINVVVTYPNGQKLKLIDVETKTNFNVVNIAKGASKMFALETDGKITYSGETYYFEANSNINLKLNIKYNGPTSELEYCYMKEYNDAAAWGEDVEGGKVWVKIDGEFTQVLTSDVFNENTKYYNKETDPAKCLNRALTISNVAIDASGNVNIPYGTPFSITVKEKVSNSFTFEVTPYLIFNVDEKDLEKQEFTLITANGPSAISLSYNSAILYPNDTTIFTAYVKTDLELKHSEIKNIISISDILITNSKDEIIDNDNYISLDYIYTEYNSQTGIQIIQFEMYVKRLDTESEKRFVNIKINVSSREYASVDYTILPQRINSIEIKNYYKDKGDYVLNNILQQDKEGLIIIDMAPSNGYFDYLEIVDSVSGEEILFTQLDSIDGNTLPYIPAKYGKGNRLVKDYMGYDRRIYVETETSSNATSRVHTIIVYAFLEDGTCLNPTGTQFDIDVKMLPQITAEYRAPNGEVDTIVSTESGYNRTININLAIGTNASFYVTTRESDGIVKSTLSNLDGASLTNIYKFEHDNGNFYKLAYTSDGNNFETYVGNRLQLVLETQSYLKNGVSESAKVTINIKFVYFVVHDVSVTSSTEGNGIAQIYGNVNQDVELELYFKPTDISFYVNGKYWDQTYSFDSNILTVDEARDAGNLKPIHYINDILRELNAHPELYINQTLYYEAKKELNYFDSNGEVKNDIDPKIKQEINDTKDNSSDYVRVNGNTITVLNKNYNKYYNVYLSLNLNLTPIGNGYFKVDAGLDSINKSYLLNFTTVTSPYEPQLIKNENDFLSLSTGYYILGNDLFLENYTPIEIVEANPDGDAQLIEFDGNGRTITITSFNTTALTEENLMLGLFKSIPQGTTIKNVTVKYLSVQKSGNYSFGHADTSSVANDFVINSYFDLCSNKTVNYSTAKFGGIAATNSGVITNCNVIGEIALRATTIESKSSGKKINFNLGGIVETNNTTGYITNSTSGLRIFASANMGGLVHSNQGVIASCAVDQVNDYSFSDEDRAKWGNGFYENSIAYKANSPAIYKPLMFNYNEVLNNTVALEMGGFAVSNSGKISMSYVNYATTASKVGDEIGNMSAKDTSAGFIYNNTGSISDAYVVITKAQNNNNTFYGFVAENSGTIKYVYTYVNGGICNNNNIKMFAEEDTINLYNCIEWVSYDNTYSKNSSEGLFTEKYTEATYRNIYEKYEFAFGDNLTAVWRSNGGLPQLVSTHEKVVYTKNEDSTEPLTTGYTTRVFYYGLKTITVTTTYKDNVSTGNFEEITTEETDHSSYGTKQNPIIILDRVEANGVRNWDSYFTEANSKKYFRIVTDISFKSVNKNPTTSTLTFSGNIQGNNMILSDIMLYSTNNLQSIGLFKEIKSINDRSIESTIRNLTLTTTSVWATKTNTVGLLAGVIENYNLYNISIDSSDKIIVGGNAVGGIAGIIRGNFNMQRLTSNIGANSTKESSSQVYFIYASKNNGVNVSENLVNVYYAGSIAGIVDGYDNGSFTERDIVTSSYFQVKDVYVNGPVVLLADTVGAAFGLVGERVMVTNAVIDLTSSKLSGAQYSSGFVGENRGVINNVSVTIESATAFTNSNYVSAGIVGLNAGGLVQNSKASFVCEKIDTKNLTIGGIVGRNIYGMVTDSHFNGGIVAYFAGGIIGSNYTSSTLKQLVSGSGALTESCKVNTKLLPTSQVVYKNNGTAINNLTNLSISTSTLSYFLKNIDKYYSISKTQEDFSKAVQQKRVLGLCIGLTDNSNYVLTSYGIIGNGTDSKLMFNSKDKNYNNNGTPKVGVIALKLESNGLVERKQEWPCANVIKLNDIGFDQSDKVEGSFMTYITGAVVNSFDNWVRNGYAADMLVLTDQDVAEPMWKFKNTAGQDVKNYYISIESTKVDQTTETYTVDGKSYTKIKSETVTYTYVLRNLDTSNMLSFICSEELLENFKPDSVATTEYTVNYSATHKSYTVTIEGTSKGAVEYPLTYNYVFKVV